VSGSSFAITITGTSSIQNDGMIKQTATGRAIRDNTRRADPDCDEQRRRAPPGSGRRCHPDEQIE
jgi:hypothetical protein